MAVPRYQEIFRSSAHFQRAVNLSMDLGDTRFMDGYIPTEASADILKRYLEDILQPGGHQASVLIGPYGKGKSHTLVLVLSLISDYSKEGCAAADRLVSVLSQDYPAAAERVRQLREQKKKLLPVVINDRYLSIQQAFQVSLRDALARANLGRLMPDNYFSSALTVIRRWKEKYPETFKVYENWMRQNGQSVLDMEDRLKRFDSDALTLFQRCHREILAGTPFDPLLESDVPSLYDKVARILTKQTDYRGLFVVFDEFGKYLESAIPGGRTPELKILQELAELCDRKRGSSCLVFTCVSHKAIGEYASRLSDLQRTSFRTVEGRFDARYFVGSLQGDYDLIAGALGRKPGPWKKFCDYYHDDLERVRGECRELGLFSEGTEQMVEQSMPLHPLTAQVLLRCSELAAQNERTLFTFLADPRGPLQEFIRENNGDWSLVTVDMVYRYFSETIRENTYDNRIRDLIVYAQSLFSSLTDEKEKKLVQAIVLFTILGDAGLPGTENVIRIGLQWSIPTMKETRRDLERDHLVYVRRSDGVLCLMRTAALAIRDRIEAEIGRMKGRLDLAAQLSDLLPPGFTLPRRYNDEFGMVRFFRNVFLSEEEFFALTVEMFRDTQPFADGYVICLLEAENSGTDNEMIQKHLQEWDDPRILVLTLRMDARFVSSVEECVAIREMQKPVKNSENTADPVEQESLAYYFDDMMQVVTDNVRGVFGGSARCVTKNGEVSGHVLSQHVSEVCEQVYGRTPLIRHEMMNRTQITGTMRGVRERVLNAVLQGKNAMKAYKEKTAEGAVLKATLGYREAGLTANQMECWEEVQKILREFLAGCEGERQPVQVLYDQLMAPPYGMRKGVLPILLADCLRERKEDVTVYNEDVERPLNGETLQNLDEHTYQFSILVEPGSNGRVDYLTELWKEYVSTVDNVTVPDLDMRRIYEAMCRNARSLPDSARSATQTFRITGDEVEMEAYPQSVLKVRQILLQFGGNPREALLDALPHAVGMELGYACADEIIHCFNRLKKHVDSLIEGIRVLLSRRLHVQESMGQSLFGAKLTWARGLTEEQCRRPYDDRTAAFLKFMQSTDYKGVTELCQQAGSTIMGLGPEDWKDVQVWDFKDSLERTFQRIEKTGGGSTARPRSGASLRVQVAGKVVQQSLTEGELEGLSQNLYSNMESTLKEFGESIPREEKMRVLAKLILSLN